MTSASVVERQNRVSFVYCLFSRSVFDRCNDSMTSQAVTSHFMNIDRRWDHSISDNSIDDTVASKTIVHFNETPNKLYPQETRKTPVNKSKLQQPTEQGRISTKVSKKDGPLLVLFAVAHVQPMFPDRRLFCRERREKGEHDAIN